MIKNVLSFYNKKVGFWNAPIFIEGKKEDIVESYVRGFKQGVYKGQHVEELDVYFVGEWDDKLCEFTLLAKPEFLFAFDTLVEVKKDESSAS